MSSGKSGRICEWLRGTQADVSIVIADDDYKKKEIRGRRGNTSSRSKIRTEQSVTSAPKPRAGERHVVDTNRMPHVNRSQNPGYLTSSGVIWRSGITPVFDSQKSFTSGGQGISRVSYCIVLVDRERKSMYGVLSHSISHSHSFQSRLTRRSGKVHVSLALITFVMTVTIVGDDTPPRYHF
jgi:hypothetical protein